MNKIDFAVVFSVENANPNGDPVNGNMPRQDYDGYGEVSTVCIKRKIRNRMEMTGHKILQTANTKDGTHSISAIAKAEGLNEKLPPSEFKKQAAKIWTDVRAFGALFGYKFKGSEKGSGVSIGIRGPVTVTQATSLDIIDVKRIDITGVLNKKDNKPVKDTTTMGVQYRVNKAAYVFYGSINPQLADLVGFSADDAQLIKDSLCSLFEGDESEARPAGSMAVQEIYWWEHNCPSGQYPSVRVHKSVEFAPKDTYPYFESKMAPLPNLKTEIIRPLEGL